MQQKNIDSYDDLNDMGFFYKLWKIPIVYTQVGRKGGYITIWHFTSELEK